MRRYYLGAKPVRERIASLRRSEDRVAAGERGGACRNRPCAKFSFAGPVINRRIQADGGIATSAAPQKREADLPVLEMTVARVRTKNSRNTGHLLECRAHRIYPY
jgi:hypothetical protein